MGIGRADFARLLFFSLPFFLHSRFFCSLYSPTRVVRSFASTIGPCRLVRDCPTAKETEQMSVALRGSACTRLAKLLINAHGNLSFSLIPPLSFSLPYVKVSWVGPFGCPRVAIHATWIIQSRCFPVISDSRLLMKITWPRILRRSLHRKNSRTSDSFQLEKRNTKKKQYYRESRKDKLLFIRVAWKIWEMIVI